MNSKISIIVPVYKVEAYLECCVESIVNQDYQNLEIILVDDGSPDNSPQICDAWAARDPRIRVIHKENGGPSAARNRALDIATGDYFYFVDSDDYIDHSLCSKMMEIFAQHDVDIVTFNSWRVNEQGTPIAATETIREEILTPEAALTALFQGKINHYAWNKIYKRRMFDGIRFPEGRLWEDVAISYKLLLNAKRIYCCPEKLYYYRERGDSIVAVIDEKALCDIFLARYECYRGMVESCPSVSDHAFGWVALAALNLYDRSLWAQVDEKVLSDALAFLAEHKTTVLEGQNDKRFKLYYTAPKLYAAMRICVHRAGNIVKRTRT